jgi:hypothetical protein
MRPLNCTLGPPTNVLPNTAVPVNGWQGLPPVRPKPALFPPAKNLVESLLRRGLTAHRHILSTYSTCMIGMIIPVG